MNEIFERWSFAGRNSLRLYYDTNRCCSELYLVDSINQLVNRSELCSIAESPSIHEAKVNQSDHL